MIFAKNPALISSDSCEKKGDLYCGDGDAESTAGDMRLLATPARFCGSEAFDSLRRIEAAKINCAVDAC